MAAPARSAALQPRTLHAAAPTRASTRPAAVQRTARRVRASSRDSVGSAAQDSRSMLNAFFVGRALAEVLNERLGAALGDALAEIGKWDAETRQTIREVQEEALSRAQREMLAASGVDASSSSGGSSGSAALGGGAAAPPDMPALVDELRAEVAATRAVVQQLKLKQQQQQQGAGGSRR